eukprot:SAG22_NODE_159_length_16948_cov_14.480503_15_plen_55_part_00
MLMQWHWEDAPTLKPASFSRGAISLGPELWQWIGWVGGNISHRGSYWPRQVARL